MTEGVSSAQIGQQLRTALFGLESSKIKEGKEEYKIQIRNLAVQRKNLIDLLKQNRTNDGPSHLVINMAKTPKRPEISAKEFAVALDITPTQVIDFDSFLTVEREQGVIAERQPLSRAQRGRLSRDRRERCGTLRIRVERRNDAAAAAARRRRRVAQGAVAGADQPLLQRTAAASER